MSAFRLQGLLLSAKPEEASSTSWRGQALERLTPDVIADAGDLIQELGGFAGLFFRTDPSPWRDANLADGNAVTGAVDTALLLAQNHWPELKTAISAFLAEGRAASPSNLCELRSLLEVQRRINKVLGEFDSSIFAADLDQLVQSMSPAAGFFGRLLSWCLGGEYRNALRRLRSLSREPKISAKLLLARVRFASMQLNDWTTFADRDVLPVASKSLDRCSQALDQVAQDVHLLELSLRRSDLMTLNLDDLGSLVGALAADRITPFGCRVITKSDFGYLAWAWRMCSASYGRSLSHLSDGVGFFTVPGIRHVWKRSEARSHSLEVSTVASMTMSSRSSNALTKIGYNYLSSGCGARRLNALSPQ
jgi:hypothetical protein